MELVLDFRQECLGFWVPYRDVATLLIDHIMTTIWGIKDASFARGAERLDREQFSFFHFYLGASLDDRNTFAGVDCVGADGVAAEILHGSDWICLVPNRDFMRFHYLLNGLAYVTKSHVDTSCLNTLISSFFHGSQQWIEHWVECHCKRAVYDMTVDLCAEIDFHHIVVIQDGIVSWIWCVVGGAVVDATPCWEADTLLDAVGLDKASVGLLYTLANINEFDSRSHVGLCHFSHLTVALSSFSEIVHFRCVEFVPITKLSPCCPHRVKVAGVVHP